MQAPSTPDELIPRLRAEWVRTRDPDRRAEIEELARAVKLLSEELKP